MRKSVEGVTSWMATVLWMRGLTGMIAVIVLVIRWRKFGC